MCTDGSSLHKLCVKLPSWAEGVGTQLRGWWVPAPHLVCCHLRPLLVSGDDSLRGAVGWGLGGRVRLGTLRGPDILPCGVGPP